MSLYERLTGGGSGIRTHDTVSRIHAFQACAFSHSAIPPHRLNLFGGRTIVRTRPHTTRSLAQSATASDRLQNCIGGAHRIPAFAPMEALGRNDGGGVAGTRFTCLSSCSHIPAVHFPVVPAQAGTHYSPARRWDTAAGTAATGVVFRDKGPAATWSKPGGLRRSRSPAEEGSQTAEG